MPEPTPATPETSVASPAASAAPQVVEPTPQTASREALYSKYYESQPGSAPPAEVNAPSAVADAPVAAAPPDYQAAFLQLQNELTAIKQALIPATPLPVAQPAPGSDWFELLQAGKRTEAEAAMRTFVASGVKAEITQNAVLQALETMRIQDTVNGINNDLRVQNPDLVPLEEYVAMDAKRTFDSLPPQLQPKTAEEYIKVYTRVVSDSAGKVRKQFQLARAAGKADAMTISREVVNASTLTPNSVTSPRAAVEGQQTPQDQAPDNSPESYFAMRARANAGARGLSQ
jgi:hypothetical protein